MFRSETTVTDIHSQNFYEGKQLYTSTFEDCIRAVTGTMVNHFSARTPVGRPDPV